MKWTASSQRQGRSYLLYISQIHLSNLHVATQSIVMNSINNSHYCYFALKVDTLQASALRKLK